MYVHVQPFPVLVNHPFNQRTTTVTLRATQAI